jgi:hypothetical protein
MIPNINKQIVNKLTSNPEFNKNISNPSVSAMLSDIKKYENKEATASGGSGQYSAPLFGDMKENDEEKNGQELNFFKSIYNPEDKSYIAAYKIIDDSSDKFIEVLNIHENEVGRIYMDGKETYEISIFKFKLPKSQIKILDDDTGFTGFKFIKIPYWLVKKDPTQYKIKRLNKKKRLSRKYSYPFPSLSKDVDDNVVDYITTTDGDKESIKKIRTQLGGEPKKVETKEATGAASAGAYVGPSIWAKSSTKKNWRGARKTQIPGGKFVEVRKKCQKFPYCNQGDMKALKIFENEKMKDVIKNISKKHNISENVIKNILTYELGVFRKYKK